jgi:transcriptional regulator with XRE-family HTH domain
MAKKALTPADVREAMGMNQTEISVKYDISVGTISKFESGKLFAPSFRTMNKLEEAYGKNWAWVSSFLAVEPEKGAVGK